MGPLGTVLSRENSTAGTDSTSKPLISPRKELPLGSLLSPPLLLMLSQAFHCPVTASSIAGKVGESETMLL